MNEINCSMRAICEAENENMCPCRCFQDGANTTESLCETCENRPGCAKASKGNDITLGCLDYVKDLNK